MVCTSRHANSIDSKWYYFCGQTHTKDKENATRRTLWKYLLDRCCNLLKLWGRISTHKHKHKQNNKNNNKIEKTLWKINECVWAKESHRVRNSSTNTIQVMIINIFSSIFFYKCNVHQRPNPYQLYMPAALYLYMSACVSLAFQNKSKKHK